MLSLGRDMNFLKSDKCFENCPKMWKKWLINVSEEPDMINATHDNGRSLKQVFIRVSWFLVFQAIRKSKKYVEFNLTPSQDLFHAPSSVKDGESDIC